MDAGGTTTSTIDQRVADTPRQSPATTPHDTRSSSAHTTDAHARQPRAGRDQAVGGTRQELPPSLPSTDPARDLRRREQQLERQARELHPPSEDDLPPGLSPEQRQARIERLQQQYQRDRERLDLDLGLNRLDQHDLDAPTREQFPPGSSGAEEFRQAQIEHRRDSTEQQAKLAEPLERRIRDQLDDTQAGRELLADARRNGTDIVVLPDDEQRSRFPGTLGIFGGHDNTIYIAFSALRQDNATEIAAHELMHAYSAHNHLNPLATVAEHGADPDGAMERLGFEPGDLDRYQGLVSDWPAELGDSKDRWLAVEHTLTDLGQTMEQFQREGRELTPTVRRQWFERTAETHLAKGLLTQLDRGALTPDALHRAWISTGIGSADAQLSPDQLVEQLRQMADPSYVDSLFADQPFLINLEIPSRH